MERRRHRCARAVPAPTSACRIPPMRPTHSQPPRLWDASATAPPLDLVCASHACCVPLRVCQGFDRDHDGKLSIVEFTAALRHLGYNPTQAEVTGLSQLLDTNDDGTISYFEFLQFVHGTPHQSGPAPVFTAPVNTGSNRFVRGACQRASSMAVCACWCVGQLLTVAAVVGCAVVCAVPVPVPVPVPVLAAGQARHSHRPWQASRASRWTTPVTPRAVRRRPTSPLFSARSAMYRRPR